VRPLLTSSDMLLKNWIVRFTVYPRQRFARRDQSAFKVKSILKGAEYEGKPFV
jgi:hypothetical protein